MKLNNCPNLIRTLLLVLSLAVWSGCGDEPAEGGTDFEAPAWLNNLRDAGPGGGVIDEDGNGTTPGGQSAFHGVRTTISGIAQPLIVPEVNVVENTTQVNRVLTATGTADDGQTALTLSWTVVATVAPPVTLFLVTGPQATGSFDEAIFVYNEALGQAVAPVSAVTSGELVLNKWNDIQVRGTFEAEVILADGSERSLSDGIIDVRLNQ